ncbi:MAG: hypothetical protein ACXWZS_05100 [Gemmatirosa sp.]
MARRTAPLLALAALVGCSASNRDAPDARDTRDTAATVVPESAAGSLAAPSVAPAPISLAAVAGRWQMRAVPVSGDTTPTTYVLTATADTNGWSIAFPDGPPVPLRVIAVAGDSIVAETGLYRSVRRRGVQVRTHNVMRLDGDQLVGAVVARYQTTGPDSVLRLQAEGTRRP